MRNRTREAVREQDPADQLRHDLRAIADTWDDLQDAATAQTRAGGGGPVTGTKDHDLRVGWHALTVERDIRNDLAFTWRVLAEETTGPLRHTRPVPEQCTYLADWRAPWLAHHPDLGPAIVEDWARNAARARTAAYPEKRRTIDVGVRCVQYADLPDDTGARVVCGGAYQVTLDPRSDLVPDLVCSADATHRISPVEWQRMGRRAGYDVGKIAELMERRA